MPRLKHILLAGLTAALAVSLSGYRDGTSYEKADPKPHPANLTGAACQVGDEEFACGGVTTMQPYDKGACKLTLGKPAPGRSVSYSADCPPAKPAGYRISVNDPNVAGGDFQFNLAVRVTSVDQPNSKHGCVVHEDITDSASRKYWKKYYNASEWRESPNAATCKLIKVGDTHTMYLLWHFEITNAPQWWNSKDNPGWHIAGA